MVHDSEAAKNCRKPKTGYTIIYLLPSENKDVNYIMNL